MSTFPTPNPKALHALLSFRFGTLLDPDLTYPPPLSDAEAEARFAQRLENNRLGNPQTDSAFTWRGDLLDTLSEEDREWQTDYLIWERGGTPMPEVLELFYRPADEVLEFQPLWLSPEGKFWHVEYSAHSAFADVLAKELYPDAFRRSGNGEHVLEEAGWAKITFKGSDDLQLSSTKYEIRPYTAPMKRVLSSFLSFLPSSSPRTYFFRSAAGV